MTKKPITRQSVMIAAIKILASIMVLLFVGTFINLLALAFSFPMPLLAKIFLGTFVSAFILVLSLISFYLIADA